MRVALYARTSTQDRQDPQIQIHELRTVAQQRGWSVVEEFIDTVSGAKARRPGLDRMLNQCTKHKFDCIAITRLDRLARNLSNLIRLVNELNEKSIVLVSLKENFDLSTSGGRLAFHLFGAIAEFERQLTAERIQSALNFARFRGVKIGRPSTIDQKVIAAARELLSRGESVRSVAKSLRISPSAAHKILKQSRNEGAAITNINAPVLLGKDQIHILTKVPSVPNYQVRFNPQ